MTITAMGFPKNWEEEPFWVFCSTGMTEEEVEALLEAMKGVVSSWKGDE